MKIFAKHKWIFYLLFLFALPIAYYILCHGLKTAGIALSDTVHGSLIDSVGIASLPTANIHFFMAMGPFAVCLIIALQSFLLLWILARRINIFNSAKRKYVFSLSRLTLGTMLALLLFYFIHETYNNQLN